MDIVYYTRVQQDTEASTSTLKHQRPVGPDTNLDNSLIPTDDEDVRIPTEVLGRTQRLDQLLQETSRFLQQHPRPPQNTRLRRSLRTIVSPERYQDGYRNQKKRK